MAIQREPPPTPARNATGLIYVTRLLPLILACCLVVAVLLGLPTGIAVGAFVVPFYLPIAFLVMVGGITELFTISRAPGHRRPSTFWMCLGAYLFAWAGLQLVAPPFLVLPLAGMVLIGCIALVAWLR